MLFCSITQFDLHAAPILLTGLKVLAGFMQNISIDLSTHEITAYEQLIKSDGQFSVAWLLSFFSKKTIPRSTALQCSVSDICQELIKRCPTKTTTYSEVKKNFSLYLHGRLLYGATILMSKKQTLLEKDVESLYEKLRSQTWRRFLETELNSSFANDNHQTIDSDLDFNNMIKNLDRNWLQLLDNESLFELTAMDEMEIPLDFLTNDSVSVNAQTCSDISLLTDISGYLFNNALPMHVSDFSDSNRENNVNVFPNIDHYEPQPDAMPPEYELSNFPKETFQTSGGPNLPDDFLASLAEPQIVQDVQPPSLLEPAIDPTLEHEHEQEPVPLQNIDHHDPISDNSWQTLLDLAAEERLKKKRESFSERMARRFKRKKLELDTTTKLSEKQMKSNIESYRDTLVDRRVVIPNKAVPTVDELLQLVNPAWPKELHYLFRAVPHKTLSPEEMKKLFNTFPIPEFTQSQDESHYEDILQDLSLTPGYAGIYEESLYDENASPGWCDDLTRMSREVSEEAERIRRKTGSSVFQHFESEIINDEEVLFESAQPGRFTITLKGKILEERQNIYDIIATETDNAEGSLEFSSLLPILKTPCEIAAKYFGCLLDLLALKEIKAEQHEPFGEIFLSKR